MVEEVLLKALLYIGMNKSYSGNREIPSLCSTFKMLLNRQDRYSPCICP